MRHGKLTGFLLGVLMMGLASVACGGVPDLDLSMAWLAGPAGASVFNLPNGLGAGFNQARLNGAIVDATIHLRLVDSLNQPIAFYPSEDMWLGTNCNDLYYMNYCLAGSTADFNTDANGNTLWQSPMEAGGYTVPGEVVWVMIAGSALNQPGLNLKFNSADITGDLVVDLVDITYFATDFWIAWDYRSDFIYDGVINLSDVSMMAQGLAAACQ